MSRIDSILAVFGLCAFTSIAQAQHLETTRDVNVRKGPSTSSAVITSVGAGTVVDSVSARRGYDRVQLPNGKRGWIYARYLHAAADSIPATQPPVDSSRSSSGGTPTGITAPSAYHGCPLEGNPSANGPNPAALRALNVEKNRFTAPVDGDIDRRFTLDALLQPGADDSRFDATKGGVLEGIVLDVKVGGIETVNCRATDSTYRDTHIEIARSAGALTTQRVIVEVTPRWRDAMNGQGADWSTHGLRSLIGKRVQFRGWQLYDVEHRGQAMNTAPTNGKDWRATVWELHPVTSFVILTP